MGASPPATCGVCLSAFFCGLSPQPELASSVPGSAARCCRLVSLVLSPGDGLVAAAPPGVLVPCCMGVLVSGLGRARGFDLAGALDAVRGIRDGLESLGPDVLLALLAAAIAAV